MKAKMAMAAALATLVTVGGVYATWTFSEGNVTNASTTVNVAMTGVNSSTEKGTLSVRVMGTNGYTLAVDDSNNDHIAEIMATGVVTVTFKPSADASSDIKSNGIDVQCVISYEAYTGGPASLTEWKYDGKQIFDIINDAEDPIVLEKEDATFNSETGEFVWTIEAEDVGISLQNEFFIDTLEKYNQMNAELAKGSFKLTVSEYTPELT